MSPFPAAALTNGPLPITIGGTTYNVYYTTSITFSTIQNNIGAGVTPNNTSQYSLTNPNLIDGFGANSEFMIPWWGSSSDALSAARAWYNAASFPNDAVKFPVTISPGVTATPLFAWRIPSTGVVGFAAKRSDGVEISTGPGSTTLSDSIQRNFALVGISN